MQETLLVYRITQCDFMILHKLLYDTDQAQALPTWLNCLVMQFLISTTPYV